MLDMVPLPREDAVAEVLTYGEEAPVPSLRWSQRSILTRWTGSCGVVAVVAQIAVVLVR